jgi:hypothetical protein
MLQIDFASIIDMMTPVALVSGRFHAILLQIAPECELF